jgi:hypothetical protein
MMAVTSTLDLVNYYANLLIFQYKSKPNAYNTVLSTVTPLVIPQTSVQSITFSPSPTSGTFVLSYDGIATSTLNWNDSAGTIQTALRLISGLGQLVVTGSIADGLTVTFNGLTVVAQLLVASTNNLLASSSPVTISIVETDLTLPLAVQNAFDINTAIGVQLDILGKYTGVVRTISTPNKTITLSDDDFRTLIKFAVVQNNSGSSLGIIESNLNQFFEGKFIVTDYKTMNMSYIFAQSIGSSDLFTALVQEKLIPKPMAVGFTIINPPDITQFFGFSLYENGGVSDVVKPFNTYEDFNNTWAFLQYQDFIF